MKQQIISLVASLVYWIFVGLILVAIVNRWPWLASSPWLFAVFGPFFVVGFVLRSILRKKLLARNRAEP